MSGPEHDRTIDYIEFQSDDLVRSKDFYARAFGWRFTDYGDDYTAFEDGRLSGGFHRSPTVSAGGPLVILYAVDLEGAQAAVEAAGGAITVPIFAFPGGRRFHFRDPSGNVLAVWSEG